MSKRLIISIQCAICLVLLCICAYKAATLSMTHDESGTYLFWAKKSIFPFFTDPSMWSSANNHLLNTKLFQVSDSILGHSALSIRLPNVISFIIYAVSSVILISRLYTSKIAIVFTFCFLILNPYAFDFFSLCRGYGLSLAFISAVLFMLQQYFKNYGLTNLVVLYACIFLSSVSILSTVILLPAISIAILILSYKRQNFKNVIMLTIFANVIIFAILNVPLRALSSSGEFGYGISSLWQSWQLLNADALMGRIYFGNNTILILSIVIAILLLGGIIVTYRQRHKHTFGIAISISLICIVAFMFFGKHMIGIDYPINRKSLFIIPFIGILLGYFIEYFRQFDFVRVIAGTASIFLLYHFINSVHINQTREWWYDSNTKQYISEINTNSNSSATTIGCNWLFHPTLRYYIETNNWNHLKLQDYNKELDLENNYDYFIGTANDNNVLSQKYIQVNKSATDAVLFKKK